MVKTQPYRISRTRLAWLASEEYLRSFWWFALTTPIAGIFLMVYGQGFLPAVGLMGFAWPFSIPARAVLSSSKASRLFTNGCLAEVGDEFLTFYDTSDRHPPLRWRLPLVRVRDVVIRGDCLLVRMRKLGFAPIPVLAFETDENRNAFLGLIGKAIEERYAEHEAPA
jgi:hypothetical protein